MSEVEKASEGVRRAELYVEYGKKKLAQDRDDLAESLAELREAKLALRQAKMRANHCPVCDAKPDALCVGTPEPNQVHTSRAFASKEKP